MQRRAPKKVKKHSILLRIALLVFVAYSIHMIVGYQIQLLDINRDYEQLAARRAELNLSLVELETLLNSDSQDLIIRAAQDRLGYVFPNETIFVVE